MTTVQWSQHRYLRSCERSFHFYYVGAVMDDGDGDISGQQLDASDSCTEIYFRNVTVFYIMNYFYISHTKNENELQC